MFGSLLKLAADVVTAPIEIVKDVCTVGGIATDKSQPYTAERVEEIIEDIEDLLD